MPTTSSLVLRAGAATATIYPEGGGRLGQSASAGVAPPWPGPRPRVGTGSAIHGLAASRPWTVTMATGAFALPPEQAARHGVRVLEPDAAVEVRYRFERADELR